LKAAASAEWAQALLPITLAVKERTSFLKKRSKKLLLAVAEL
jgi:hypothetical protein